MSHIRAVSIRAVSIRTVSIRAVSIKAVSIKAVIEITVMAMVMLATAMPIRRTVSKISEGTAIKDVRTITGRGMVVVPVSRCITIKTKGRIKTRRVVKPAVRAGMSRSQHLGSGV